MPTYEYKCNNCEEIFERFQKITDPPLKDCPICGGKLTRLISGGIGIIFKGSGFYQTDYRSDSYRKAAEKDKPPAPKESASNKKSETGKDKAGKVSSDQSD